MTIELLHIDCMEYMATQADNAFDLAIVDPPYGIGKALTSGGKNTGGWHRMVESGADQWDIAPPKEYFIDEQRFGPYKLWHHQHIFVEVENGVLMTDIVTFKLPGGFIGNIAISAVRKQLVKVFTYRTEKIKERFVKYDIKPNFSIGKTT